MTREVFICHASEDKHEVVTPLVGILSDFKVTSWYDSYSLKVGDSLRGKIDEGIAEARHGVVVFSRAFFAKKWPREELDGLFTRRTGGGEEFKIIPVWHNVTYEEVASYSPTLAGKLAANTSEGLDAVAAKIRDAVLKPNIPTDPASYAHRHIGETLRLPDIPRAYGWLENHYFSKCYITGPAVVLQGPGGIMSGCGIASPDAFFPLPTGRNYFGFIGVRNCAFIDCTFDDKVGFAIPEDNYEHAMKEAFSGPQWKDDNPKEPPTSDSDTPPEE